MKEHFNSVAALIALFMVVAAVLVLTLHGMKDETLLAILATGSVSIAQQIAGVKQPQTPPPGSAMTLTQTVPPDPSQPVPAPSEAKSGIERG